MTAPHVPLHVGLPLTCNLLGAGLLCLAGLFAEALFVVLLGGITIAFFAALLSGFTPRDRR